MAARQKKSRLRIHTDSHLCLIRSVMELQLNPSPHTERALDLPGIMRAIAVNSARPRYTFMVLDLIARAAGKAGQAGPHVREGDQMVPIREWLSTAIAPSAARRHQRRATTQSIRRTMEAQGLLPDDSQEAARLVEDEVANRVRVSGMTAVSRAVSELVKAGLIQRHYQGYRIDHENRGAQRQAVYTVPMPVRAVLERGYAG